MYPVFYFIFSSIIIFILHKLYLHIQYTFTTTKVIDIVDNPKKHMNNLETIEKNNNNDILFHNLEDEFEKQLQSTHTDNNESINKIHHKKVTSIDNLDIKPHKNNNQKKTTSISDINEIISKEHSKHNHSEDISLKEPPTGNNMKDELANYLDNFDT